MLIQYEKAASILASNDPPVVLAKVDANEEKNRELASKYDVSGFPTLKIIKNQGASVQEYKGPRETEGIVEYLKKQVGPASVEIKTADEAAKLTEGKKVFIVSCLLLWFVKLKSMIRGTHCTLNKQIFDIYF